MSTATLAGIMQRLPQELFDAIHEIVFVEPETVVAISADYKPPLQLQMDRATRKDFAASYYANTTFVLTPDIGVDWIHSLTVEDFNKITHLKLYRGKSASAKPMPPYHDHPGPFLSGPALEGDVPRFLKERFVELMEAGGLFFSACEPLPRGENWCFSVTRSATVFHAWMVEENVQDECLICEEAAIA